MTAYQFGIGDARVVLGDLWGLGLVCPFVERHWVGPDGLQITGAVRAGRQVLRLRRNGRIVADCRSVEEVARYVDLADLCEVIPLPRRPLNPALQAAGKADQKADRKAGQAVRSDSREAGVPCMVTPVSDARAARDKPL
ncbi:hypothetical protein [Spongiactinospora gelatinilytica]|uniref:hypothetical protein n=1 Tax=Spongiactinospora gelatinilytica TaxID=2666298 RepID=UPI0018F7C991|nr:hypothetical protein [Spongiactinospora gelatinilytica]